MVLLATEVLAALLVIVGVGKALQVGRKQANSATGLGDVANVGAVAKDSHYHISSVVRRIVGRLIIRVAETCADHPRILTDLIDGGCFSGGSISQFRSILLTQHWTALQTLEKIDQ